MAVNSPENSIVARLSTCKESALTDATLTALEPFRQKGRLAEVYLQFANSEQALQAYLGMETALQSGSLELRDIECIKLLVSQLTQCDHCLSIHSFKAGHAGIGEDDQMLIRQGKTTGDERTDVLVALVISLFKTPGVLDDDILSRARAQGLTDENLVDVCMAMSTIFFTNITNHINHSVSALPAAKPLPIA